MILWVLFIVGVSGLTATIHAAVFGPRAKARRRLRAAARELVDGAVVTLTGKVVAKGKVLESPLSGRDGVAFSASARIYTGTRRGIPAIAAQIHEAMMVEFELVAKDGTIVVLDSDVVIEFPPEPIIPRKIDREQRFLAAHGHDIHPGSVGFDEVVVTNGMKVSVHGAVRIEAAPTEAGYRETGQRITLAAPPGHPLTIGRPV
jgi:hypothetical protein